MCSISHVETSGCSANVVQSSTRVTCVVQLATLQNTAVLGDCMNSVDLLGGGIFLLFLM